MTLMFTSAVRAAQFLSQKNKKKKADFSMDKERRRLLNDADTRVGFLISPVLDNMDNDFQALLTLLYLLAAVVR